MATSAKAAFEDAKAYVDHKKDPAMFSMLAGLYLLAKQLEDVERRLKSVESDVTGMR